MVQCKGKMQFLQLWGKAAAAMDAASLEALVYDPSKCSKLSMEQKRELVYEISNWPDDATEILQAWSRQEILQILCAELGKERKYTGLTKSKIIEHLLKIIYEKKSQETTTANVSETLENGERIAKRQRKSDHPENSMPDVDAGDALYCKNSACKAKMNRGDVFCKRCSCCICRQYDDNKDPSLWLICNSDPPFHGVSCGMSCHLECALRHENSGISKDRQDKGLDGSFCCVSCGKVNDLLGSWRKQLLVARDTRRVDILCYRLCLAQKILAGTKHYQNLCEVVDDAVEKLEEEMGPLTGLPVKKARGIVNRLSSGPEIQRHCASAVDSLDLMLSERVSDTRSGNLSLSLSGYCKGLDSKLVQFEDIRASSLMVILDSDDIRLGNVVGYTLWHRKANDIGYPSQPTGRLFTPKTKFLLSGLNPDTEYFLKVIKLGTDREMGFCEFQFQTANSQDEARNTTSNKGMEVETSQSPATNYSSLSNPSSVEDETNNGVPCSNEDENRADNYLPFSGKNDKNSPANLLGDTINEKETSGDVISLLDEEPNGDALNVGNNGSNTPPRTGLECVPYKDSLQITPCKLENLKNGPGRKNKRKMNGKGIDVISKRDEGPQAGSSSKKRSGERRDEECDGIGDKDLEYYVKVIRCLECDGHVDSTFRQKFLTWYGLRATREEIRVVKVFVDTFIEDPESLAGQLVDTFSDVISNKRRCSKVPSGFCLKLWH
ncbi:hypothetical protein BUALT_Bualt12G0059300 [Buddleja alternifolia]|uniref:Uncharacterized protein n=1 Tax=Buddleja alternifolia TaxID=168488 RepID=A0AAV6WMZ2_9LAMI|nr:hypothetical protein BUALT_Bualt12G0059300 [Buddleja alternifolia]